MKKLQGVQKLIASGFVVAGVAAGLFTVGGMVSGAQADVEVATETVAAPAEALSPEEYVSAKSSAPAPSTTAVPTTEAPPVADDEAPAPTTTAAAPAPTTTAAPAPAPTTTAAPPTTAAPATTAPPTTAAPVASTTVDEEAVAENPDAGNASLNTACESRIVQLINNERANNGLAPVSHHAGGQRVARAWTLQMADSQHLAHNPSYGDQLRAEGINWSTAGENVAYNHSADAAHQAFMNSSGHRANILNPSFTGVGVGCATDAHGTVWVTENFWG